MKSIFVIILALTSYSQNSFAGVVYETCYTCHKGNGRSWVNEIPALTGQNKEYLRNQILNFQSGQRRDNYLRRMNGIVRELTPTQIEQIVEHYSSIDPMDYYDKPRELNERRLALYNKGKQYSAVCLGCHMSAEVRPVERSDWPYISGQNEEAIRMQLENFVNGNRNNPMMDFIKKPPFNDPEVLEGLSIYFSRQKPPSPSN